MGNQEQCRDMTSDIRRHHVHCVLPISNPSVLRDHLSTMVRSSRVRRLFASWGRGYGSTVAPGDRNLGAPWGHHHVVLVVDTAPPERSCSVWNVIVRRKLGMFGASDISGGGEGIHECPDRKWSFRHRRHSRVRRTVSARTMRGLVLVGLNVELAEEESRVCAVVAAHAVVVTVEGYSTNALQF